MTDNNTTTETTTSTTKITFGTPPDTRETRERVDWKGIADQLYNNPGQWARVDIPISYSTARTRVSHIRRNLARGFEEGTWDARTEKADEENAYVWLICTSPDRVGDVSNDDEDEEIPFA